MSDMRKEDILELLIKDKIEFNNFRKENGWCPIDLSGADLSGANLSGADLTGAKF